MKSCLEEKSELQARARGWWSGVERRGAGLLQGWFDDQIDGAIHVVGVCIKRSSPHKCETCDVHVHCFGEFKHWVFDSDGELLPGLNLYSPGQAAGFQLKMQMGRGRKGRLALRTLNVRGPTSPMMVAPHAPLGITRMRLRRCSGRLAVAEDGRLARQMAKRMSLLLPRGTPRIRSKEGVYEVQGWGDWRVEWPEKKSS